MTEIIYKSPLGPLILIAAGSFLVYCNYLSEECEYKLKKVKDEWEGPETIEEGKILSKAAKQLDSYFIGDRICFDLPIKFKGTSFQNKVWQELLKIRYGETKSYKAVSKTLGSPWANRAVANACGANPLAIIIPCHRIISSDGSYGGYTGGKSKKEILLRLESQTKG